MPVYFLNWPERVHRVILPRNLGNLEKMSISRENLSVCTFYYSIAIVPLYTFTCTVIIIVIEVRMLNKT